MDMSSITNAEGFRDFVRRNGGTVTDGPVGSDFASGWAKHPLVGDPGGVAHFWIAGERIDQVQRVRALCGVSSIITERVPLLGAGNCCPCSRCDLKLLSRWS